MTASRLVCIVVLVVPLSTACSEDSASPIGPSPILGGSGGVPLPADTLAAADGAAPGASGDRRQAAAAGPRTDAPEGGDANSPVWTPGPVRNLSYEAATRVRLTWNPPQTDEWTAIRPIQSYPITRDGRLVGTIRASECRPGCSFVSEELGSGSYTFTVRANNGEQGPPTSIVAFIATTTPAAVRQLRAEQVPGDNAVRLTWKPPLAAGQPDLSIIRYYIGGNRYPQATVPASVCTGQGSAASCATLQEHLSYPDTHVFMVYGFNSAGFGARSSVAIRVEDPFTGEEPQANAFTASFSNAPSSHSGRRFNVELTFSEDFRVSYRRVRAALVADGGRIVRVSRTTRGSNRGWRVRVRPRANRTLTLTLPGDRPCAASGALCTTDGRPLTGTASISVPYR